ncbi:MAG: hypothetical protein ACRD96_25020 [Bryobacteraceae bacterium]
MAAPAKARELDCGGFPPGTAHRSHISVCLACIFDVFTKQLKMAPRTAYSEVKRHTPSVAELIAAAPSRPYFRSEEKHPKCPYCNSAKRWHARLEIYRIDGGKTTDAPRRALVKSLPKSDEQFQMLETKSDHRAMLFEWFDSLGQTYDFDEDGWLGDAARAWLERKEPKTDWAATFAGLRAVRRSSRIEAGWEVDDGRLFLAPLLYNEVLLVQYLVSRSHKAGGRTFEGRLTLFELMRRLRYSGYLTAQGITEGDSFEALEQVVEHLTGGEGAVKLHYIVDRRELLEKVKTVYASYAS